MIIHIGIISINIKTIRETYYETVYKHLFDNTFFTLLIILLLFKMKQLCIIYLSYFARSSSTIRIFIRTFTDITIKPLKH